MGSCQCDGVNSVWQYLPLYSLSQAHSYAITSSSTLKARIPHEELPWHVSSCHSQWDHKIASVADLSPWLGAKVFRLATGTAIPTTVISADTCQPRALPTIVMKYRFKK